MSSRQSEEQGLISCRRYRYRPLRLVSYVRRRTGWNSLALSRLGPERVQQRAEQATSSLLGCLEFAVWFRSFGRCLPELRKASSWLSADHKAVATGSSSRLAFGFLRLESKACLPRSYQQVVPWGLDAVSGIALSCTDIPSSPRRGEPVLQESTEVLRKGKRESLWARSGRNRLTEGDKEEGLLTRICG